MSTSLDIKNLSIALEALSRFPSNELDRMEIQRLLVSAIVLQKEENKQERERRDLYTQERPDPNDDIPF